MTAGAHLLHAAPVQTDGAPRSRGASRWRKQLIIIDMAQNRLWAGLPFRSLRWFCWIDGHPLRDQPKSLPWGVGRMNARIHNRFLCGALALLGATAALAPAEAAVYRGRFDPLYGAPFTDPALAWSGSVTISVDDSCITPGGTASLISCPGGISVTDATVNLYEATITNPGPPPTYIPKVGGETQSLDFGSTAGLLGLGWLLSFDSNKKLKSVNSTAFDAIQGAANSSLTDYNADADNLDQAWFSLQFLGDYAQLYWFDKEPTGADEFALTAGLTVGSRTYLGICRDDDVVNIPGIVRFFVGPDQCGWSDPDNISPFGAFITFEQVPEPATYALVPIALALMGAAGALNRRRRAPLSGN